MQRIGGLGRYNRFRPRAAHRSLFRSTRSSQNSCSTHLSARPAAWKAPGHASALGRCHSAERVRQHLQSMVGYVRLIDCRIRIAASPAASTSPRAYRPAQYNPYRPTTHPRQAYRCRSCAFLAACFARLASHSAISPAQLPFHPRLYASVAIAIAAM